MKDPYKLLGLHASATSAEIKTAWKQSVLKHHPDKGGDSITFIAVNKAYEEILAQKQNNSETYNYHNWSPKTSPLKDVTSTPAKTKTPKLFTLKISILAFTLPILSTLLSTPGYLLIKTPQPVLSVNSLKDVLSMTLPFILITLILRNKLYKYYIKYPKSSKLSFLALIAFQPLDPLIFTNQPILMLYNIVVIISILLAYYLFKARTKTQ
jgi:hypothetical protein